MILARALVAAGIAAAGVSPSAAQDRYPTRPITLVVPFAAGGASDVLTRIVAESLGQRLGQSIIIQNVAGAGGTVGSGRVVKSVDGSAGPSAICQQTNASTMRFLRSRVKTSRPGGV